MEPVKSPGETRGLLSGKWAWNVVDKISNYVIDIKAYPKILLAERLCKKKSIILEVNFLSLHGP